MHKHTDISQQIKKYLNGELDAQAMHELERRAQDDPFLMDALEGYGTVPVDQDAGLNELQSRLQRRIEKKPARIIAWRVIAIAASILLLLGIGLFWYTEQSSPSPVIEKVVILKPPVNAPQAAQKAVPVDSTSTGAAVNINNVLTDHSKRVAVNRKKKKNISPVIVADAEVAAASPAVSELQASSSDNAVFKSKDTTPLNEMVVMDYTAKKKSNELLNEKPISAAADSAFRPKGSAGITNVDTSMLNGKVVRIKGTDLASANIDKSGYNAAVSNQYRNIQQYTNSYPQTQGLNEIAIRPDFSTSSNIVTKGYTAKRSWAGGNISPFNPMKLHGEMVRGMVKMSGAPVAYASVKIKGTNISTLTDAYGRFTLYTVPDMAILQVTVDGDVLKETKVTRHDMQVITLQPVENDNNPQEDLQPRPSTGWNDFYDYLHQNAVSPNGRKVTVKLSFKVNADNSLSDFKIIKGISPQTNNAAVKLVKDGPVWYSPSDDKAETVTISIKFRVRKK